jgi:hypothetical protein
MSHLNATGAKYGSRAGKLEDSLSFPDYFLSLSLSENG